MSQDYGLPICPVCGRAVWERRGRTVHRWNGEPICVPPEKK